MATQNRIKSPPNLSFPPRYHPTPPESHPVGTNTTPRSLPAFNFPLHPPKPQPKIDAQPQPQPQPLPDISTPLTPPTPNLKAVKKSTFLTIPLEIRLEIYTYVLLSHSIRHPHLAPVEDRNGNRGEESGIRTWLRPAAVSLPSGLDRGFIVRSFVVRSTDGEFYSSCSNFSQNQPQNKTRSKRRNQTKVLSKIPTALLQSCSQIYTESHLLPFQHNTFLFVNWFWSGVYASRQFMRGLKLWQGESLRRVGVEVLGRNLCETRSGEGERRGGGERGGEGKGVKEWIDVCRLWSGVRVLSLCVKGNLRVDEAIGRETIPTSTEQWKAKGGEQENGKDEDEDEEPTLLNVSREWVSNGLYQLRNLRQIELEIPDDSISTDSKLRFCARLEEGLNLNARKRDREISESEDRGAERGKQSEREDSREGPIQVIFIARFEDQKMGIPGPEEEVRYFGGDVSDWALSVGGDERDRDGGSWLDM